MISPSGRGREFDMPVVDLSVTRLVAPASSRRP